MVPRFENWASAILEGVAKTEHLLVIADTG